MLFCVKRRCTWRGGVEGGGLFCLGGVDSFVVFCCCVGLLFGIGGFVVCLGVCLLV